MGTERGALAGDNVGMETAQEALFRNETVRNMEEALEGGVPETKTWTAACFGEELDCTAGTRAQK